MMPNLKMLRESGYWEALGRFIEGFAEIEQAMSGALWSFAKTPPEIARALFSGTRADGARQYINRILDATKAKKEIKDQFQHIFTQMGHINDARNLVIHHETVWSRQGWKVSNRRFALDRARLKERPISVAILNQMSQDLEKISAHLMLLVFQNERAGKVAINTVKRAFATELAASWLYKPPRPPSRKRRTRSNSPKRQRRLSPSPVLQ